MHASLVLAALALAGQVVGAGTDDRYGDQVPAGTQPAVPLVGQNVGQGELQQQDFSQPFAPSEQAVEPSSQNPIEQPKSNFLLEPNPTNGGNQNQNIQAQPLSNFAPSGTAAPRLKPAKLMKSFLEEPARKKLVGTPWSLAEVVQSTQTRNEQTLAIQAYWELVAAIAKYHLSLDDVVRLKSLQQSVRQPGAQWGPELQAYESRVMLSGRTAKVAQHRLQRLLGRSADESLPLPSDTPHCGAYDARYDEIFADRSSQQAGQLNKLLSLNYQSLQKQANSVSAAYGWLHSVSQTRNPGTDGEGLLRAYELLTLRRYAFIDAVCEYNVNIASYAEIASPGEVGTGRLVAMLIGLSPEQKRRWSPAGLQPASAEETIGSRPKTFGSESANPLRKAETPPDGVNRSILRPANPGNR